MRLHVGFFQNGIFAVFELAFFLVQLFLTAVKLLCLAFDRLLAALKVDAVLLEGGEDVLKRLVLFTDSLGGVVDDRL